MVQPIVHTHLATLRRGQCQVHLRVLPLAYAAVELGETQLAVGDQRTHTARLGERRCLAIVGLAALDVERSR